MNIRKAIAQKIANSRALNTMRVQNNPNLLASDYDELFLNQKEFGKLIANKFIHSPQMLSVLALALTQSGKTGSMLSTFYHLIHNQQNPTPPQHCFVITGYSSQQWVEQTKDRMPMPIQNNVFHRNTLHIFYRKLYQLMVREKKNNFCIIIDETQIATKIDMTIHKIFKQLGIDQLDKKYKKDIKFVYFTATPDGVYFDLSKQDTRQHTTLIMKPTSAYTSIFKLLDNNRIFQCLDLACYDKNNGIVDKQTLHKNLNDFFDKFNRFYDTPSYHIIRTHNGKLHQITIDNFDNYIRLYLPNLDVQLRSETKIDNLDNLLKKPPTRHVFIFIKEKLRCAKTLNKTYIGILYERCVANFNDSAVIQGLAGRLTGYKSSNAICFSNIKSVNKYNALWNIQFNDPLNKHKWTTPTTKFTLPISHKTLFR